MIASTSTGAPPRSARGERHGPEVPAAEAERPPRRDEHAALRHGAPEPKGSEVAPGGLVTGERAELFSVRREGGVVDAGAFGRERDDDLEERCVGR
jgi:hypothetical protein